MPKTLLDKMRSDILIGKLVPGSKVNESKLAKSYRVSRTPIREALTALVSEALVKFEYNRGFWISELDKKEVTELYPIVSSLETLAMKDGGLLLRTSVTKLRSINSAFLKSGKKPAEAAELDLSFHEELTRHTENRSLLSILHGMKARLSRYEKIYMQDHDLIKISAEQHTQIIENIESARYEEAGKALAENWEFGMKALLNRVS